MEVADPADNGNRRAPVRKAKKGTRKRRAKQWTYYIETLKTNIDCIYEMCRMEQSLNGCKEAVMYLKNSARDFESLTESIKVEMDYEESDEKSPLMFSEVVKAAGRRSQVEQPFHNASPTSEMPKSVAPELEGEDESGWQLVRGRRRRSTSSLIEESAKEEGLHSSEREQPPRPANVYERLSGSSSCGKRHHACEQPQSCSRRAPAASSTPASSLPPRFKDGCPHGSLMYPRSAMDLPQTKASMAKMAYSRQLLWERTQSSLLEKLKTRQARYRSSHFGETTATRPRRVAQSSINFADAASVPEHAAGFGNTKRPRRLGATEGTLAVERSHSLGSIRETAEDEKSENIPIDPKPSSEVQSTLPMTPSRRNSFESQGQQGALRLKGVEVLPDTISLLSLPVETGIADELENDETWREMTEEEESLAFEERSLHIEIEQEQSLSIDAELERQVAAEAEELERLEKLERDEEEAAAAEKLKKEEEKKEEEEVEESQPTFLDVIKRWEIEMKDFATMSWGEIMEKEFAGHYREPGEAAARHERMLSPSRRRCDKNDSDFSRKHEEKQRRADILREKLQSEKAARLRMLSIKVEEVRTKRMELIERKRLHMEAKMEKAKENREKNLEEIVKRARDDEQRVLEVHLINSLEAGNMRQDQRRKEQDALNRRQTLADERAKKIEEKAAKEAKAEERRRTAETERIAREKKKEMDAEKEQTEEEGEKGGNEAEDAEKEQTEEEGEKGGNEADTEQVPIANESDGLPKSTWAEVIDWLKGEEAELVDVDKYRCEACGLEILSKLEAVSHVLSTRHHSDQPYPDLTALESELNSALQVVKEVRRASSQTTSIAGSTSQINSEDGNAKARLRRKKAKRENNKAATLCRETQTAMARVLAGRDGQSMDTWRSVLSSAELCIKDENAVQVLLLFAKKEKPKSAILATEEFLQEYAREEPSQESELILLSLVDATIRAAQNEWQTRRGREADESPGFAGPAEKKLFEFLKKVTEAVPAVFKRLLSCETRFLLLLRLLLLRLRRSSTRFDSKDDVTAPALFILAKTAGVSELHQIMCDVLGAPSLLAAFPMPYLVLPPLKAQLIPALVSLTINNASATKLMAQSLSPRHILFFFESLENKEKPEYADAETEAIVPRSKWVEIAPFYEQFIDKRKEEHFVDRKS